jgi:bacterioferritin (cytochrome b1)
LWGRLFQLANQLNAVEQDLKAERAATKTLRKKIEMLEAGKGPLDSLKVIEETICDREKTIAATQDRVKMLERSSERKGLAMATAASVLKLSKPPV